MSFKGQDQRKTKNINGLYPNSLLNNKQKPNQLSFMNALRNNNQKQKLQNLNNNKKRNSKGNNLDQQNLNVKNKNKKENNIYQEKENKEYDDEDSKEEGINNPINNIINKDQEEDIDNIIINEDNEDKKKLHNVDSFPNIEFLLPKKNNLNENTNNNKKNVEKNIRYINQGDYDYDGNANNNININIGFDYSNKKNNNNNIIKKKEKTINMNQIEYEEDDSNIKDSDVEKDYSSHTYSEEELEKFKKQEELIKKLLKYKNFQKYIKRILKKKKLGVNRKGKKIRWTIFKKYLYEIAFLDLYYMHRIPFIIMRPRLDVIRKKREKRKKEMLERQKIEEETKNYESRIQQKVNIDVKEGENLYASIFQNEIEKNGFIVGEDNNTVRIEKRESLFPSRDGKPKGTFTLTKIPQKTDDNTGNIRLKMAFNKAKDAARVVRRLEYSYSMRVNILLSKPIFQKNARIIQNWYRSMKFIKINKPKILKIQAFVRGMMIRKAFREILKLYKYDLPFLKEIDKIISRKYAKIFFDKLISRFGIRLLIKLAKIKCNKIISALIRYKNRMNYLRKNFSIGSKFKRKCVYTKDIYEFLTRLKIIKLQTHFKRFIMHNSEKILLKFTNEYNPKLYYYLKYGNNKYLLKRKLKLFRGYLIKFKELQMRIKYKKYGVNNKYEFLEYLLRKRVFNILKKCYKDSINNTDINYQRKVQLRILMRRMNESNNKRILKRYLNKWNLIANYLTEYRNILKIDKLLLIQTIMKYHKKFREKVFMLLMNRIKEHSAQKEKEASKTIFGIYQRYNKLHDQNHINNVLLRVFKKWKRNAKLTSLNNAADIINRNTRLFLSRKKIKKKYNLIKCIEIRNKVIKEKLRLWKFNSGKLQRHYNSFINRTKKIIKMRKILSSLRKILASLEEKKKNILRKYFERFQMNTGVKKLLYINFQMCLYDENKQPIVNDKYSMMKYIKDQYNVSKEELKNKMTLKAIFNFWKSKQKFAEFKKKCKQRIIAKCESEKSILKLKLIQWNKKIKLLKIRNACQMIQKNYRIFKRKKNKK